MRYGSSGHCGKCDDGWINFPAQSMGWVRVPDWDTETEEAYVSPGGCKDMHPKGCGALIASTLCNCQRRDRNLPPMPVELERLSVWAR